MSCELKAFSGILILEVSIQKIFQDCSFVNQYFFERNDKTKDNIGFNLRVKYFNFFKV